MLEKLHWHQKRSAFRPRDEDGVRNIEKHIESYWEMVTDTRPGTPDANGIPGPPHVSTRNEMRVRTVYTCDEPDRRGQAGHPGVGIIGTSNRRPEGHT